MKYATLTIGLLAYSWSPSVQAEQMPYSKMRQEEHQRSEIKHFELSVMPSYANDFDYSIVGGEARFSYLFTRIFSFGIRSGGNYATDGFVTVPFDLLSTWTIPVGQTRFSIPITLIMGYRMGLSPKIEGDTVDHLVDFLLESGVKVRINDWGGVTALIHGGCYYYTEYWPKLIIGASLGPFFSF